LIYVYFSDGEMDQCGFQGSNTLNIFSENGFECCNPYFETGHLAMAYTGLASLITLGDDLSRVNRVAIIKGVRALQQEDGR
jgi:geranylgeranyl transferase type-1 subunit beta